MDKQLDYLLQFYSEEQIKKYANGDRSKIDDLWKRTQPKKVPIASLMEKQSNIDTLVSSPDGWVKVTDCVKKSKDILYRFTFESGTEISASYDHLYQKPDLSWHYAKDLSVSDILLSETGEDEIVNIERIEGDEEVYDLSVDHDNHRYYTAGICSHNTGKSVFLANLGVNWVKMGLNVVYLTFELSEKLVAMRIDSMIADVPNKQIFKNLDDVSLKVSMEGKKSGAMQIKYMPSGKTANDVRAYLKELEVKTGRKVDVVLVDYLDLMMPAGKKISAENLFVKDKYVSEELRNLAMEMNCIGVSASQLNRGAQQEVEFDHSHISGGLSKIQTADNVIGIFTSKAMKERGRYQIQFLKTRNSGGVGSKVDLAFDVDTLRITDCDDQDGGDYGAASSVSSMVQNLGRNGQSSGIPATKNEKPVKAEADSTMLRQFINNLGQDDL